MSLLPSRHLFRCPSPYCWPIVILLAASSLGCGDDDPVIPQPTPVAIEKVQGDGQAGRVSQELSEPLVVRVLDASDVPLAGVSVIWVAQGEGSVSPDTVVTDSQGMAAVQRVLGPTAGDQTTTAAVSGVQGLQVTFTSRALVEASGS